jgi:hypothetical protein
MSGIKKRHIGIVEKRAWIGTGNWDPTGFWPASRRTRPPGPSTWRDVSPHNFRLTRV